MTILINMNLNLKIIKISMIELFFKIRHYWINKLKIIIYMIKLLYKSLTYQINKILIKMKI